MKNELFGSSLGLLIGALCTTGVVQSASGQVAKVDGKLHPMLNHKPGSSAKSTPGGGVAGAGCEYRNDDGENDGAFGQAGDGTVGSVVGFVAVDGCTTISSIQVAWGPIANDGQPCTLQIYVDPNKDGDPSDLTAANRIAEVTGAVANPDTDIFNDYPLDAPVVVDGMFWVVAITDDVDDDVDFPCQYTNTCVFSPLNYLLLGIETTDEPFDGSTLLAEDSIGDVNFMVRAIGDGTVVSCFNGDTNGDCIVNVTDLVSVINTWGGDGQGNGFDADLNNDCVVDVTDLVNGVINNWGECDCVFRACCFENGSCEDLTPDGCFRIGGAIQPAGSSCADTECENLFGACCLDPGECIENLPADCAAAGGNHQGVGTSCASGDCDPQSNDLCAGAIALAFGELVTGTTENSTDDLDAEAIGCVDDNNNPVTAPGNWYKVTGNGNTLTASMCSLPTSYDAKLYVYCGTCDGFFCLAGDDDGCAGAGTSEVAWCSENGQEYLILVTGFANGTGPYELVVTSGGGCGDPTPCQSSEDVCGFALPILPGQTVQVDNSDATVDQLAPDCGGAGQNGPGVWLKGIGDGTRWTVELCSEVLGSVNTRLSVYCGPCDELFCVDQEPSNNSTCDPFTEQLTFCSELGTEYLILVSGAGPDDTGAVNVTLTSDGQACKDIPCQCPECPVNDDCENAIAIDLGMTVFDTSLATEDGPELPDDCEEGFGLSFGPDIWYIYMPPSDGTLTVSTCGEADYDTRLAAYAASSACDDEAVVACNDDAAGCAGNTSIMEVPVSAGVAVRLRVGGFGTANGAGTLDLTLE